MDILQVFLFAAFGIGILLIIYGAVNFPGVTTGGNNLGDKLKEVDTSVANADNAIAELNDVSKAVFKQLDEKYKELLFIYNLIDEKKSELAATGGAKMPAFKKSGGYVYEKVVSDADIPAFKSTRFQEISELRKKGLSVEEIARSLNIGKGEVQLILDLGRVR